MTERIIMNHYECWVWWDTSFTRILDEVLSLLSSLIRSSSPQRLQEALNIRCFYPHVMSIIVLNWSRNPNGARLVLLTITPNPIWKQSRRLQQCYTITCGRGVAIVRPLVWVTWGLDSFMKIWLMCVDECEIKPLKYKKFIEWKKCIHTRTVG